AGWAITRSRAYHLAPWLDRGVEVCADLGLDAWRLYMLAYRARYRLDVGDWEGAADDAGQVLRLAESVVLLRLLALTVLGLLEARRGGPHARRHLDDALALTADQTELQYLAPVAAARGEAAYLAGALHEVEPETSAVLATAAERGASWVVGELLWLRRLAGVPDPSEVLSPVTDLDSGSH